MARNKMIFNKNDELGLVVFGTKDVNEEDWITWYTYSFIFKLKLKIQLMILLKLGNGLSIMIANRNPSLVTTLALLSCRYLIIFYEELLRRKRTRPKKKLRRMRRGGLIFGLARFLAQAEEVANKLNDLELKENSTPYRREEKKLWQALPNVIWLDGRPMPRKSIKSKEESDDKNLRCSIMIQPMKMGQAMMNNADKFIDTGGKWKYESGCREAVYYNQA
ncbi:Hypothetical predicted protein [Olea europaea subsp. europaea]|uniref:Uncharacterized protein n=1 Tax=Olea europaea subsp. europaea TaxID=158383 RepID=A0A8S0R4F4_OLEEU|nr:Hypothetical predicted protein [Olea europaea subsp. europaea]